MVKMIYSLKHLLGTFLQDDFFINELIATKDEFIFLYLRKSLPNKI